MVKAKESKDVVMAPVKAGPFMTYMYIYIYTHVRVDIYMSVRVCVCAYTTYMRNCLYIQKTTVM